MNQSNQAHPWMALGALDAVSVTGSDARAFLQAQLSCDLRELDATRALPFAWCKPSGRVNYSGWIVALDDALLLLPARGAGRALVSALEMFVLRAAVHLTALVPEELGLSWRPVSATSAAASTTVRDLPGRQLALRPDVALAPADDNGFRLAGIRAGTCELPPGLADRYLPQMLNLDLTGGLSFGKGCFPGQEVIARTHHLGRLKRRLLRFSTVGKACAPGERVLHGDEEAGRVIVAADTASGSELLAVTALETADARLVLAGEEGSPLCREGLPYALPGLAGPA